MKYLIIFMMAMMPLLANAQIECCNGGSTTLDAGPGFTTYAWSNSASTQTISPTTAGIYTVTVTDGNGCTASADIAVSFCPALTATTSSTDNTSCEAPFNGTATATPSGGCTGGYTYAWNTTPPQTTATATGLEGGTYMVTITTTSSTGEDCEIIESVTVTDTVTPPSVSITATCD